MMYVLRYRRSDGTWIETIVRIGDLLHFIPPALAETIMIESLRPTTEIDII